VTTRFDADILAQGEVLGRLLASWEGRRTAVTAVRDGARPDAPVILTGMGASLAAISIAEPVLRAAGRPVGLVDAGELGLYGAEALAPGTLVLMASQTGQSRETVATAAKLRGRGSTVIALVNDMASPLAGLVDLAMSIEAGPEDANACKTFTATQLLALLIAGELAGSAAAIPPLHRLPVTVEGLSTLDGLVDAPLRELDNCGTFALLAHGPTMSTARYGALLAKEMLALPGEAATVSEFRHGPVELVARRIGSIVLAAGENGRAISLDLASSIAERGGPVWLLATGGDLPTTPSVTVTDLGLLHDLELPIAAAVALQRFFSVYARRLGRTPGVFTAFDPIVDTGREEIRTLGR
jgi:glucosamine--fructose-6-phosphate aminotransferase (isomerizing)